MLHYVFPQFSLGPIPLINKILQFLFVDSSRIWTETLRDTKTSEGRVVWKQTEFILGDSLFTRTFAASLFILSLQRRHQLLWLLRTFINTNVGKQVWNSSKSLFYLQVLKFKTDIRLMCTHGLQGCLWRRSGPSRTCRLTQWLSAGDMCTPRGT